MAKYIGKRIVPVHCGRWDQTKTYEMLSIVLEETSGDSYISRRAVPSGTAITDTNYWMLHSLYSQQIKDTGITILLQMDEDGTGYLDYGDRRDSFTWDEEGIFLNGVKLLYSIRKDTLRIGVNDQEMLFTRR